MVARRLTATGEDLGAAWAGGLPDILAGDGAVAMECFQLYAAADDRGRAALADRILDGA